MTDEIDAFWQWFASHAERLQQRARVDALGVADEVGDQLAKLGVPLQPEIGVGVDAARPVELVLHADGNREHFELARSFVRCAPTQPGWEYTALRPAIGFEFSTEYQGYVFDPEQIWFRPLHSAKQPTLLGLRLGIPGYLAEHEDAFWTGAMILLSSGLGEASAAEDIAYLEVTQLPDEPDKDQYLSLRELPAYIAERKRSGVAGI